MSEKRIVIDINEDGAIHAETFGMQGTECVVELDKLMKDIARQGKGRKKTEFFDEARVTNNTITAKRK